MAMQMQPGDWYCPACGDHQFARNTACRRCGAAKSEDGVVDFSADAADLKAHTTGGQQTRAGDWICPCCSDLQFARNTACRQCGAPKPEEGGCKGGGYQGGSFQAGGYQGGGKGGGIIPPMMNGGGGCGGGMSPAIMNGKPGDWLCPSCGDHQFARNTVCRRCSAPRPDNAGMGGGGGGNGMNTQMMQSMIMQQMMAMQHMMPGMGNMMGGGGKGGGCKGGACKGGGKGGKQERKPGDWDCPGCQDLQFARNTQCRMCGTPKPEMDESGADLHDGGRPRSRSPRRG